MDLELPPEMPNGIGVDDDDDEDEDDDRDGLDDSYDLTGMYKFVHRVTRWDDTNYIFYFPSSFIARRDMIST